MDLSRVKELVVGGRFGSYRGVCAALDEKVRGGGAKVSQLNRWKLQFSWEVIGNTWEITAVHPDEGAEIRGLTSIAITTYLLVAEIQNEIKNGNKIIIVNDNETQVSNARIAASQITRISINKPMALNAAGLIGRAFYRRSMDTKASDLERDFFASVRSVNGQLILNALQTLEKARVVLAERSYEVTIAGRKQPASVAQTIRIDEIHALTLTQLDCKNLWEVKAKGHTKRYYHKVDSMVLELFNITSYSEVFVVTTSTLLMELYHNRLSGIFIDLETLRVANNIRSVKRLEAFFAAAYERYLRTQMLEGQYVDFKAPVYKSKTLDATFLEDNFKLIDQFIKL